MELIISNKRGIQKLLVCLILVSSLDTQTFSQVFVEKQTRHRFAQLTLGVDFESSFGGQSSYLNENNRISNLDLSTNIVPRFMIGGTHFWGHADFYIAIPLSFPNETIFNQEIQHRRGVETAFKFYPWRIENNKLRPYIGLSLAPFYFEQSNNNLDFGDGPELSNTNIPLLAGVTFNRKNQLFELGLAWNYANSRSYFIAPTIEETIETPPLYINLSYRIMLETTLSAEKDWESGATQELTKKLKNELGGFFIGIGLSSAFWLGNSSYNEAVRPNMEKYGISIMPDFNIGYYSHKKDLNLTLAYRSYGTSSNTYGANQALRRRSLVLEATKFLFDYNGFVPFVGPALSQERLSFKESFERVLTQDIVKNQLNYGITFGWDIRPNRLQSWILRTSLRWFPDSVLEVEPGRDVSFRNIEFNFIQLIIYPDRFF